MNLILNPSLRYLLTGTHPRPLQHLKFYQDRHFDEILYGNLFDGDKGYSMVGFPNDVMVI